MCKAYCLKMKLPKSFSWHFALNYILLNECIVPFVCHAIACIFSSFSLVAFSGRRTISFSPFGCQITNYLPWTRFTFFPCDNQNEWRLDGNKRKTRKKKTMDGNERNLQSNMVSKFSPGRIRSFIQLYNPFVCFAWWWRRYHQDAYGARIFVYLLIQLLFAVWYIFIGAHA